MEREPICYVCQSDKKIESLRELMKFWKGPLACSTKMFLEQRIVSVCVPVPADKYRETDGEEKRRPQWTKRLVRWIYYKSLQSKMWDVLLANQNASMQPAFCSGQLYASFCDNEYLRNELWITTVIPTPIVEQSLYLFLKRECVFRKNTKVFVADNSEVETLQLLFPYCCNLNYLYFMTEDKERTDSLADELYEESGLAITVTSKAESACEADIIIDLKEEFRMKPSDIKRGCIYFDGCGDARKAKSIRNARSDVTYISSRNYLDRALKSTL